jgi:titin
VTSVNDSGPGSLRQAIIASNAATSAVTNTIHFQIGSGGTETVALQSALPALTHAVAIDGTTQPGTGSAPRIVLDGTGAGAGSAGLCLDKANISVRGVAVDNFAEFGIVIDDSSSDTITGDTIGLTADGNTAAGNGSSGILVCGSRDNTISCNVVSGNGGAGVQIDDDSHGNVVAGNLVGTNAAGTAALGNVQAGILVTGGAYNNVIGGTAAGAGNTLSGNAGDGVYIVGSGVTGNVVEGNKIGTNTSGTAAVGNGYWGVGIQDAAYNIVGGPAANAGNVISGNLEGGVAILFKGSVGDVVQGNKIGTDVTGKVALGNGFSGVYIGDWGVSGNSASDDVIGGSAPGDGNVVSANGNWGVWISGVGAKGNVVQGNDIGTDASGSVALGNALTGVMIDRGAADNLLGGCSASDANTIEYNTDGGVALNYAGGGNLVDGNTINANGFGQTTAGLGDGVLLWCSPYSTVIDNTIEANRDWGIDTVSSGHSLLTGNTLQGNGLGATHSG